MLKVSREANGPQDSARFKPSFFQTTPGKKENTKGYFKAKPLTAHSKQLKGRVKSDRICLCLSASAATFHLNFPRPVLTGGQILQDTGFGPGHLSLWHRLDKKNNRGEWTSPFFIKRNQSNFSRPRKNSRTLEHSEGVTNLHFGYFSRLDKDVLMCRHIPILRTIIRGCEPDTHKDYSCKQQDTSINDSTELDL